MALNAPARLVAPTKLGSMEFFGLLELLRSSDQQSQGMRDLYEFEAKLNSLAEATARREAQATETERALAERQKGIDADWVRLKQAQADLDDAKATLAAKQKQNEKELKARDDALSDRAARIAEREAALEDAKGQLEAERRKASREAGARDDALSIREATLADRETAVAAREQAMNELAQLAAKVKG